MQHMGTAGSRPLILTPGEPAGIGPDLCLQVALEERARPVVVIGDPEMMRSRARRLATERLRVALVTTHLPLAAVSAAVTTKALESVLRALDRELRERFDLAKPRILVCGLNLHAGEDGVLGREERDVIEPVLTRLRGEGMTLVGPVPADTAFTPERLEDTDVVLTMYHDQGLPVLKHAGIGDAVNVTLGLPFVHTSVDHGTALALAGTGEANAGSLRAAMRMASRMASCSTDAQPGDPRS